MRLEATLKKALGPAMASGTLKEIAGDILEFYGLMDKPYVTDFKFTFKKTVVD